MNLKIMGLSALIHIGRVLHNSEIYQGIHQPIISEEIFVWKI